MEGLGLYPYLSPVATTYRIPKLTSRREFFRLPYPVTTGATLSIEGAIYKVGEVSERGLRIISDIGKFPLDAHVEGTLVLTMGVRCNVSGKVLRIEDGACVLKLERGPTTYDVIREQRHLSRTFPDWKPLPA
jgi:PilZ domain